MEILPEEEAELLALTDVGLPEDVTLQSPPCQPSNRDRPETHRPWRFGGGSMTRPRNTDLNSNGIYAENR